MNYTLKKFYCAFAEPSGGPNRSPAHQLLSVMKHTALLILISCLHVCASSYSQKVTLRVHGEKLENVFQQIRKQTGFNFLYKNEIVAGAKSVTVRIESAPLKAALEKILEDQNLGFELAEQTILIRRKHEADTRTPGVLPLSRPAGLPLTPIAVVSGLTFPAIVPRTPELIIKGRVSDEKGEPLPGASVLVKGTQKGATTDGSGNFEVTCDGLPCTLITSFVGYLSVETQVTSPDWLSIGLKTDNKALEEVVVVGFSTQKKVNLTGAVGTVDTKDLEARPVKNVTQMLQGLVPGLNISQSAGGALENNPTINIRGITTIGNGSSGAPLVLIDGMAGDIHSLNPQDVESVSVLKDASASSIYGSRAAFGVILVTTKSGKEGKTMVSYNNNFRFNSPVNMPDMVDSYRFALYFNDASINSGANPFFSQDHLQRILGYQQGTIRESIIPNPSNPLRWHSGYNGGNDNVDWYKALYKDHSFSHEHNLSVQGSSGKLRYFVSGNYLNQNGLLRTNVDDYNRLSTSVKISADLNRWAKFSTNTRFISENRDKPYYLNNTLYSDLARQGWPMLPLYDPNGYLYSSPSPALDLRDGGRYQLGTQWLYQQLQFTIEPIRGFKTFAEMNYRLRDNFNHYHMLVTYNHDTKGNPYVSNANSGVYEYAYRENFINTNLYTEYANQFKNAHNVKVLIGFQSESDNYRSFSALRRGIQVPSLPVIDLTTGYDNTGKAVPPTVAGARQHWATAGVFGRVNYDFREKYLLEFNLRYDGTSRYRSDNRWNWFPSVSAGWNLAAEDFMKVTQSYLDNLKIRASYGVLGNQNTTNLYPTYQTMPVSTASGGWLINGQRPNVSNAPGLISSSMTWERVSSWNIGLDMALFRNRLTASLDYFQRYTLNMVGPAPELPVVLGTPVPVTNNTDLKTYGFEAALGWRDKIGQTGYHFRFNLSDSQTDILSYPNPAGLLSTYRTGQKVGEIWGYETIGIAKTGEQMAEHLRSLPNGGQNALGTLWEAGDIMYRDRNGDGKIDAGSGTLGNPGDMRIIGNHLARLMTSADIGFQWKNLQVNALFQGVLKRDFFLDSYYFWGMGRSIWFATAFEEHMDYFRADSQHPLGQNTESYYPRPVSNGSSKNQQPQTRYLQNAAYIRLKNLQINYTLPGAWTSTLAIKKLRVYVSGENLWTGTSVSRVFDPETIDGASDGSVVYPLFKVISGGINIEF